MKRFPNLITNLRNAQAADDVKLAKIGARKVADSEDDSEQEAEAKAVNVGDKDLKYVFDSFIPCNVNQHIVAIEL